MTSPEQNSTATGVVVIGRNEGERLRRCLTSLRRAYAEGDAAIVYVDSGSTDGSLALAKELGADVVKMDMARPFTAARARNAGVARLRDRLPSPTFIQFIDGDCELDPSWPEAAMAAIAARDDIAVVCGRRREVHPEQSIYNFLCDVEWNTPVGEALACGGDFLARLDAFLAVGGFRDSLIAGEEPELCFRLRQAGWRINRIDNAMTQHDAGMHRFSQWWKRTKRSGHAFAEGYALHGRSAESFNAREVRSVLFWGLALPTVTIILAIAISPWSAALLFGYAFLFLRVFLFRLSRGAASKDAAIYAAFCLMGKLPEASGALGFAFYCLLGRKRDLIEYKEPIG